MSVMDISSLPAPDVVQPLDFEAELQRLKDLVLHALPDLADVLALESEPVTKVLELMAYEHVAMQARINDAAHANMLAYATGADLDQRAAGWGVARLAGETDDSLRRRTQLSMEATTVAGSANSYLFHALSASPEVQDAGVDSPMPGTVRITVLSKDGDGTPSQELLEQVRLALNADDVRPLTDTVITTAAQVLPFQVQATLVTYPGPMRQPALAQAQLALANYLASTRKLGYDITRSGLFACLHQPGVQNVLLHQPAADIVVQPHQAPHCTHVQLLLGGEDV